MSVRGLISTRAWIRSKTAFTTAQKATSAVASDAKFIPPYKSDNSWSLTSRPNRVRRFQDTFDVEKSSDPVFLRGGSTDVLLYRGIMGLSVAGIGVALFSIYLMATGNIKKKE